MALSVQELEKLQSQELFFSEDTRVRVKRLEDEVFGLGSQPSHGEMLRQMMRRNALTDKLLSLFAAAIITGVVGLYIKTDKPQPAPVLSREQIAVIVSAVREEMQYFQRVPTPPQSEQGRDQRRER